MSRLSRQSPFAREHADSLSRKARPPKDLLAWFLAGLAEELPEDLHGAGVWRDARRRGEPPEYEPVGGSVLGSPRDAESFRAFLEDDAFAVESAEYEGHRDPAPHYRTPMRAALARLHGRGAPHESRPFMARTLYRIATHGGDVDAACASMGITEPVRAVYVEAALYQLWTRFEEEPPARPVASSRAVNTTGAMPVMPIVKLDLAAATAPTGIGIVSFGLGGGALP